MRLISEKFPFENLQRHFCFEVHAVPCALAGAASALSMVASMHAFQKLAMFARVSSATPVFGPILGAGSTAIASVLAGQASVLISDVTLQRKGRSITQPSHTLLMRNDTNSFDGNLGSFYAKKASRKRKSARKERSFVETFWEEDETRFDAVMGGVLFYLASWGTFSRAMSSDVTEVGANAFKSVKANGANYANSTQKAVLHNFMKKYGCHHCGKKTFPVVGDHMPPNKKAFGSASAAAASRGPNVSHARKFYNFVRMVPSQRFYPQCESCSGLQSVAIRTGTKTLVSHSAHAKIALVVGTLIGLRHFYPLRNDSFEPSLERRRSTKRRQD